MKRWTDTDRYALSFLAGIAILAVILSQPRRYIWFQDAGTPHESLSATPPVQALESVKERAAANALQSAGLVTIDPNLSDTGTLQINIADSKLTPCIMREITLPNDDHKLLYVTESIIAIEEFNRPDMVRSVKNMLARLSLRILGRVMPMSLGIGQVRMKRFRSLLYSGWSIPGVEMPVDRRSQLEFLLDPCNNAAIVGGIVEQEFKRDPAQEVVDVARIYNGKSMIVGGFGYGELVEQSYQLLLMATPQ
jgi:hypothetical protein